MSPSIVCIQFILNIYSTMVVLRAHHCLRRPSGGPAGGYCRSSADPVACGAPRASAEQDRCTFLACGAHRGAATRAAARRRCAPQARKVHLSCSALAKQLISSGQTFISESSYGDGPKPAENHFRALLLIFFLSEWSRILKRPW